MTPADMTKKNYCPADIKLSSDGKISDFCIVLQTKQ